MRSGSLFSGYLGLDRAVNAVFGSTTAWVSDIDPGACKILAHRAPGVPNLGDITAVDWNAVDPVDVMAGGFPCQPVSHAGLRLGDLDERWLWDEFARAIGTLRPRYVVLENVRGLLSAGRGRLFGRVLGDLAAERYDAQWVCVRAADVGAPHGRARIFVLATDAARDTRLAGVAQSGRRAVPYGDGEGAITDAADERHERTGRARDGRRGLADGGVAPADADDTRPQGSQPAWRRDVPDGRTPADAESDTGRLGDRERGATPDAGGQRHGRGQDTAGVGRVDGEDADGARERERTREVAGDRGDAAAADTEHHGRDELTLRRGASARQDVGRMLEPQGPSLSSWGDYGPAIRRWEAILGRPAPAPTQPGRTGNPQLSARFVEWMQGLPAGWVTDVPGLTRNAMLKALGNGVVSQQAKAALRYLLSQEIAA